MNRRLTQGFGDAISCRFEGRHKKAAGLEKTGGFQNDLVHYRALVLDRDSFGAPTDLRPTTRQV